MKRKKSLCNILEVIRTTTNNRLFLFNTKTEEAVILTVLCFQGAINVFTKMALMRNFLMFSKSTIKNLMQNIKAATTFISILMDDLSQITRMVILVAVK